MKTSNISKLKEKAELANRILENDTPYFRDKITIHQFFQDENTNLTKAVVVGMRSQTRKNDT